MLYPGEFIEITARREFQLHIGNAGVLKAKLNGKTLPSFGETGQVRFLWLDAQSGTAKPMLTFPGKATD